MYGVPVMLCNYRYPQIFFILSYADTRSEVLKYFIKTLNNVGLSDEELNLIYKERCNLLNNDPVLGANRFQYKFKC